MKSFTFMPALALLATAASAQISPVNTPFVGTHSEGFESSTAGMFSLCITPRIFNNTADLCSPTGSATMHVTGGWGFMCSIPPHSGSRLFGSAGGPAQFQFDQDITQFGGYFGTNSWAAGNPSNHMVTVDFHDRSGALIGTTQVANVTPDCQYNWNGWSSTVGIATVTITNSAFGGGFVNLDDMEVIVGPSTIGTVYCNSNANSTGQVADLSGSGSASVGANNLTLNATDLPQNSATFFLTSLTQGNVPNPSGSQGILCLGGSIGRYVGPGQVQNSGATGNVSLLINTNAMPQPAGSVAAMVGDTWNFQGWYRDFVAGTPTSNFTNGLAVTFL
jgi:hypothetical protein